VEEIMPMKSISYEEAQLRMRAGDVIAFGGSSHFSGMIKLAIRAEVSHIGVILEMQVEDGNAGKFFNYLIDATSRQGVTISRLDDRLNEYDGEVWWLPLRQQIRDERFDQQAFYEFLSKQEGKKYDKRQAAGSAIDVFDQLPFGFQGPGYNKEDFRRFFCSELVAAGLKFAKVAPMLINASEATPIDICRWNIYEPEYYLLKGNPSKEISGYNSLDPINCRAYTLKPCEGLEPSQTEIR
jgi:hypothetical protein